MPKNEPQSPHKYTCNEYREEMILLGLKQQLQKPHLSEAKREKLLKEIERLEKIVGF